MDELKEKLLALQTLDYETAQIREEERLFLASIRRTEKRIQSERAQLKSEVLDLFKTSIKEFESAQDKGQKLDTLLREFKDARTVLTDGQQLEELKTGSQPLLDYLFEIEDIGRIKKFLKIRCGSIFEQDEYDTKVAEYQKRIDEDSRCVYTEYAQCILGSRDEDIFKLIKLYAQQDARYAFEHGLKEYRSEEFVATVVRACMREYGRFLYHVYADHEYQCSDYDRECFMAIHDKIFELELERLKKEKIEIDEATC